jgi:putative transposase
LACKLCSRAPSETYAVNGLNQYISAALQAWASRRGIGLMYIQPGSPQQNAYIERYNRTVRTEWLGQHIWQSIKELRDHATRWLWTYNNQRPNMGIGGITPAQKLKMKQAA